MTALGLFLSDYGFALLLLLTGALAGVDAGLAVSRKEKLPRGRIAFAGGCLLAGIGAVVLNVTLGAWIAASAAGLLVAMLFLLLFSGAWSEPLSYAVLGLLALGVGGLLSTAGPWALVGLYNMAASIEFVNPLWLLLLALLPLFLLISWRNLALAEVARTNLAGLCLAAVLMVVCLPYGVYFLFRVMRQMNDRQAHLLRNWVSFGLRCALVIFSTMALAEPRISQAHETLTVLFVWDRSLSVPEEKEQPNDPDARRLRTRKFMNESVEKRPQGHERDQAGLIVFGRRPRLELLPSDAPRFNLQEITSEIDGNYTDIAGALQLALASFPEGSSKRVVLISDGNENIGNAEEVAQLCKANGVQIDVVPLAAERNRNDDLNEVLVERVVAPTQIEVGSQVPIKVWVRSYSERPVAGSLILQQMSETHSTLIGELAPDGKTVRPVTVILQKGLNSFQFKQPVGGEQESYTYEAKFVPIGVLGPDGKTIVQKGLPGDRIQNNRATTHMVAKGRKRVLFLEAKAGDHTLFLDKMRSNQTKFRIESRTIDSLSKYPDRESLATFLSNFDALVLANVPADLVSEEQREVLRANTFDQGCGLVFIGGPDSYGAGGWQNTPVEKALPVDAEIKSLQVEGKSGLVLIMHASEMANGNSWQKRIAKLAVERMSPVDEFGLVYYDFNVKWQIPLQEVGEDRDKFYKLIDKLNPGDMPDFDPFLKAAHQALTNPAKNLTTRHCIIISDGDPLQTDQNILPKMKADKITVTTVGVATHGPAQDQSMKRIAEATGGRYYNPKNPSELPAIYIKETRLISQNFVHDKPFQPLLRFRSGPTAGLPETLPLLGGFVRTTPKQSPLVEIPIITPRFADLNFPILAQWQYGLGRAVAFTSDAGNPKNWCAAWAREPLYAKLWEQTIEWALRPTESAYLTMTSDYRDGRIRITVEAKTDQGDPDLALEDLRAEVMPPRVGPDAPRKPEVKFEQTGPGRYEAEFKTEEAGSYFIAFQANRTVMRDGMKATERESVRGSVTIPYAPEFADMRSNPDLLKKLAEMTQGNVYEDSDEALAATAKDGLVFREGLKGFQSLQPIWYWLLFLTAVLLLLDVAMRRVALERLEIVAHIARLWGWLRRGEREPATAPQFLERLKNRKAQVSEGLNQPRAERKFEADEDDLPPPPGAAEAPPTSPSPTGPAPATPALEPERPEEAGGGEGLDRLLKRKKQERDRLDDRT